MLRFFSGKFCTTLFQSHSTVTSWIHCATSFSSCALKHSLWGIPLLHFVYFFPGAQVGNNYTPVSPRHTPDFACCCIRFPALTPHKFLYSLGVPWVICVEAAHWRVVDWQGKISVWKNRCQNSLIEFAATLLTILSTLSVSSLVHKTGASVHCSHIESTASLLGNCPPHLSPLLVHKTGVRVYRVAIKSSLLAS